MQAIFWKEIRQLLLWGILMLLGVTAIVVFLIAIHFHDVGRYSFLTVTLSMGIMFGATVSAVTLGALQSLREIRRDRWAFLVHRNVSLTRIFAMKVAAGLSLYAAITLIPGVIAILWCCRGGSDRFPFAWTLVIPILNGLVVGIGYYFAAMLTVFWKGPWKISRILPLALAFLVSCFFAVYLIVTEVMPLFVFLLLMLPNILLAVAAWGVFVSSGEAIWRPRIATVCLGTILFSVLCCICLSPGSDDVNARYRDIISEPSKLAFQDKGPQYRVGRDGRIYQLDAILELPPPDVKPRLTILKYRFTDLEEPGRKADKSLDGKVILWDKDFEKSNLLRDVNVADIYPDPVVSAGTFLAHTSILEVLGTTPFPKVTKAGTTSVPPELSLRSETETDEKPEIQWVYSSADGWIYGYLREYELQGGSLYSKPPRLVSVVGPDGFTDATQRPKRRFSKLLDNSGTARGGGTASVWSDLFQHTFTSKLPQIYLLFEDGLFVMDTTQQSLQQLLDVPAGRKIEQLIRERDAVAIVYNDSIAIHAPVASPFAKKLSLPGALLDSFAIPREVSGLPRYTCGRVPGEDLVVFQAERRARAWTYIRFVFARGDGSVVRTRDFFFQNAVLHPEAWNWDVKVAPFLPLGPTALALIVDALDPTLAKTTPGVLPVIWTLYRENTLKFLALLLGIAICLVWGVTRTARRYGFDGRTRRVWQATAFLLGPLGVLTLWLLRDWPALERCPVYQKRRPVNCELCPYCRTLVVARIDNGTEVILTSEETATDNAQELAGRGFKTGIS